MLLSLTLQNIAVIRQIEMHLDAGFTAITGETGAGKSLLLDAVQLLFDKKLAAKNYLTHGEALARIESVWQVTSLADKDAIQQMLEVDGVEVNLTEDVLVLSREITPTGSRCRVNGTLTNMDLMARLGARLIEMHGQHDLHRLFSPAAQRDMLDNYAGAPLLDVKQQVKTAYRNWKKLQTEQQQLIAEHEKLVQERDFIAFQLAELESAELTDPEEDTELEAERLRLSNVDSLKRGVQEVQLFLTEEDINARSLLQQAQKSMSRLAETPAIEAIKEQLDSVNAVIDDITNQLGNLLETSSEDPERLAVVLERQDLLARLKRKFGGTAASLQVVFDTYQQLQQQFEALDNIQQFSDQLSKDCAEAEALYHRQALILSDLRRKFIPLLSKGILKELGDLNLENARFDIEMQPAEAPHEAGLENLQMLFSANPGSPLQPLDSVASGGELARVMLAIRLQDVGRDNQANPALIFDEIDAGLSGEALKKLAEKLQGVSKTTQVIVVTHQPLLAGAAYQQWHLLKELDEKAGTVATHAFLLANPQARKMVLAQMASGETTSSNSVAQKFAASLLG